MKVSAVIIAGNEEEKIGRAIESVLWADEVVVIDSESTDRTRQIAETMGCRVIVREWSGFGDQKQFGVDAAENDWIFSLDADEAASGELRQEIEAIRNRTDEELTAGYRIPRLSVYMGKQIRHSGWYPDRQLRFFDRRKARWSDDIIHESVKVLEGGKVSKLNSDILHFSVDSAAHHHLMIGTRYAPLAAQKLFDSGGRTSRLGVMMAGPITFFTTFFLKAGFLDGFPGFCIARFAAHHAYLKHLILFELQSKESIR